MSVKSLQGRRTAYATRIKLIRVKLQNKTAENKWGMYLVYTLQGFEICFRTMSLVRWGQISLIGTAYASLSGHVTNSWAVVMFRRTGRYLHVAGGNAFIMFFLSVRLSVKYQDYSTGCEWPLIKKYRGRPRDNELSIRYCGRSCFRSRTNLSSFPIAARFIDIF